MSTLAARPGALRSTDFGTAEDYEEIAVIGNGAYGTVYKARDLRNEGAFVAIKKIRIQMSTEEGMPMSTIREIAMLKQLENSEHPNIVRLLDVCPGARSANEMNLMIVFEHIDQDLSHYLEKCPSPGLGPDRIRDLSYQIIKGVDFLHTNRIVHRDLKPQNILVTSSGHVKLADFGLARVYGFQMALTSVVVTLWYRAPEVLLQAQYATPVDIWSVGCIFAELHTRRPLFSGQSDIEQLFKIFEIIGLPPQNQWPENVSLPRSSFRNSAKTPFRRLIPDLEPQAEILLERMLCFSHMERINAQELLNSPYFSQDGNSSMNTSLSSTPYSSDNLEEDDSSEAAARSCSSTSE